MAQHEPFGDNETLFSAVLERFYEEIPTLSTST